MDEINIYSNPRYFVNTGFDIATSNDQIDGENKIISRHSVCTNEYSTLCFGKKVSHTHDG